MRPPKATLSSLVLMALVAPSSLVLGAAPSVMMVRKADLTDIAKVSNNTGRLQQNDQDQTNEQNVISCAPAAADGSMSCLQCGMRTGALEDGTKPVHNMQCACTPVKVDAAGAMSVAGPSKWVTDNDGDEYRNCNKPSVQAINDGSKFLFMFNYQPNNSNTQRYVKVLDASANQIQVKNANGQNQKQVVVMAKNNDDCDMHQDGAGPCSVASDANGNVHMSCWAGCNGNGRDDGWINDFNVNCAAGTSCTVTKNFDVSLCPREERSRGRCNVAASDPNTAICTWTEGNNQPMRDGVWISAVDISAGGEKGADAQSRILWKQLVEQQVNVLGKRLYAQRMVSGPVFKTGANGMPEATDELLLSYGLHAGGNKNDRKGGTTYKIMAMVVKANKDGLTVVKEKTDISDLMLGIDYTHDTVTTASFGTAADQLPGFSVLGCSHNGGLAAVGQVKSIAYEPGTKQFMDLGNSSLGTGCDRHLYSNYLGNNPGVQGRNFQGTTIIKTPGTDPNRPAFSMLYAVTGKTAGDPATESMKIKPDEKLVMLALDSPAPSSMSTNALPLTATASPFLNSDGTPVSCASAPGNVGSFAWVLSGLAFIGLLGRRSSRRSAVVAKTAVSSKGLLSLGVAVVAAALVSGCTGDANSIGKGGGNGTGNGNGNGVAGGPDAIPNANTPGSGTGVGAGGVLPQNIALFESTVRPILRNTATAKCSVCHVSGSPLSTVHFLATDTANDYNTITSYSNVVGTFQKATAPMMAPPPAFHATVQYGPNDLATIGAWLDAEYAARSAAGGGGGGTGPGAVVKAMLSEFSGCMDEATWNAEGVGKAWAQLQTDEGNCNACHINGDAMFIASEDSARMFKVISSHPGFIKQFFNVNVTDPANPKMEVNLTRVNNALANQGLQIQHPRLQNGILPKLVGGAVTPADNNATKALQRFFDATMVKMNAKTCGAARIKP